MAKPNKECVVCGKKYHYCPTCAADANKPRWMTMFDCEDCYTIFNTATKFNLGKITKEEAKDALNRVDLNKDFNDAIKKDLNNIFYVEPIVVDVEPEEAPQTKKYKRNKKEEPNVNVEAVAPTPVVFNPVIPEPVIEEVAEEDIMPIEMN